MKIYTMIMVRWINITTTQVYWCVSLYRTTGKGLQTLQQTFRKGRFDLSIAI